MVKMRLNKILLRKFVDAVRIFTKGGAGGMGYPRCGGVGGKGGDVYVTVSKDETLENVVRLNPRKRWTGGQGSNSRNFQLYGEDGADVGISVPPGVSVMSEAGTCIAELNNIGEQIVIARGGAGGGPFNQFSGQEGQSAVVRLELKLIADVGLVGFPNAGKSTLLKALSRAKPKIAAYPFTTIKPEIGVLHYKDHRQITMADLPGLIEGAHMNVGLGHRFLRHIERTRVLVMIVDVSGFRLNPKYVWRSCLDTIVLLNKELELYKEQVLDKPVILVVNKMDLPGSHDIFNRITEQALNLEEFAKDSLPEKYHPRRWIEFSDIISTCAVQKGGSLNLVKETIRKLVDAQTTQTNNDEILSEIRKSKQTLTTLV